MPLEASLGPISERVAQLNQRYQNHGAQSVLERALSDPKVGRTAMVSSFGTESVVLLHMLSQVDRTTPVLFLDTEMLFSETLVYQQQVAEHLSLTDVRVIRPERDKIFLRDPDGLLHAGDPDACCSLRKIEPLMAALSGFDAWITGRKRYQGAWRAQLEFFEDENNERIKVNPLAHWTRGDVQDYLINNRLPRHPLVARGYRSIGCEPCTTRISAGEDERAGRWRDQPKQECGIHFVDGKVVPGPKTDESPHKPANTLVTDAGFVADDWLGQFLDIEGLKSAEVGPALALDLPSDTDAGTLAGLVDKVDLIRIDFPSFSDGRGFTLARRLRLMGYQGRLRAKGHVIADQFAMARRAGFEEVEITPDLARRQPEEQWLARAGWASHDYQARLRGTA